VAVELAGGESLDDLAEGDPHGAEVLQGRDVELAGLVATLSKDAAEAASALHEVVIAVFAVTKSGRTAIDSVFFNVATSFEWHKARFLSLHSSFPQLPTRQLWATLVCGIPPPPALLKTKGLLQRCS
jgi:hypothetical protein